MSRCNTYAYCFVPICKNSSKSTPEKLFFPVPKGEFRKDWCIAVGRDPGSLSGKTSLRCCEDHFKIHEDAKNWVYYRALLDAGVEKVPCLRLKSHVVPHRKLGTETDESPEFLNDSTLNNGDFNGSPGKGPSGAVPQLFEVASVQLEASEEKEEDFSTCNDFQMSGLCENINEDITNVTGEGNTSPLIPFILKATSRRHHKGIQVSVKKKNKYTQTRSLEEFVGTWIVTDSKQARNAKRPRIAEDNTEFASEVSNEKQTSPEKRRRVEVDCAENSSEVEVDTQNSDSSYKPSSQSFHTESSQETYEELLTLKLKNVLPELNVSLMERYPQRYLGLPRDKLGLIEILVKYTKCSRIDILRTLRKIKKNESYADLGDVFGVSKHTISASVRYTVPRLEAYLSSFIFWPPPKFIRDNVPAAFRINYADVQSIVDCFEVHIPKPSDPVLQALTWSDYKHDNTIKYLVSITPAGFISFISKGFGGRTTDKEVVLESGYLDLLEPGMIIMADRGFKQIVPLLKTKGCTLAKPPSVYTGKILAQNEVKMAKIVASLRINVERIIKRIREFALFKAPPLNHKLFSIADQALVIACALANIQGPIYNL